MQFRHLSVNLLPKTTAVILIMCIVVLYYTYINVHREYIETVQYFCPTFELHTIYGEKLLDRNCYAGAVTF